MKPRPTDEEFEELKRVRDAAVEKELLSLCEKLGWDPGETHAHASHSGKCYCACPDGPCQHIWDGPIWTSEDGCAQSTTCSRCGEISMYHAMRTGF